MLSDLQLLALTVGFGLFMLGLSWLANWQAKQERNEKHNEQPR